MCFDADMHTRNIAGRQIGFVCTRYRCSPIYDRIITWKMKKHFMEPNAEILHSTPALAESYESAMKASTIGPFHAVSHAMSGYASEADYNSDTDPFAVRTSIIKHVYRVHHALGHCCILCFEWTAAFSLLEGGYNDTVFIFLSFLLLLLCRWHQI